MGEWRRGKKHGEGVYSFSDGDRYKGNWRDGRKHGQGTYTFSDG
ncbi:MAG: membrane-binding protein, partial [SAR324 cluster bacterium]